LWPELSALLKDKLKEKEIIMDYHLDARKINNNIYPCPVEYTGVDPSGNKIEFTNYYMRYNGKPYYAVSGEMHFSRIDTWCWEDEIIKMKMAGERKDGGQSEGERAIQEAERDGGAGIRDNQAGDGVPAVFTEGAGRGRDRMGFGNPGV
jgi:hypothetical protein